MTLNPSELDTGFVYVATGESYVAEAAASAVSLRRYHPLARICLVTDLPRGHKFWDDLIILDQPHFGFPDKIQMHRAPYERCVFLDADTTVCGDLTPVFTILTRFDVCGVQYSEGQDYVMEGGIPAAFSEMNSGMIGFRKSSATIEFFQLWAQFYLEFHALNCDGCYNSANVGDQKSLRAALWHSNVRHVGVGAEFNFIPFKLELASLPVAVLHTRASDGLGSLAARLNARLGRRVYVPTMDVILFDSLTGPELTRLGAATAKLFLRALGRAIVPRSLRDWLRVRRGLRRWLFGNLYESPGPSDGRPEAKWENHTGKR